MTILEQAPAIDSRIVDTGLCIGQSISTNYFTIPGTIRGTVTSLPHIAEDGSPINYVHVRPPESVTTCVVPAEYVSETSW